MLNASYELNIILKLYTSFYNLKRRIANDVYVSVGVRLRVFPKFKPINTMKLEKNDITNNTRENIRILTSFFLRN